MIFMQRIMACYQAITCPTCGSYHIMKSGWSTRRVQRYRCQQQNCVTKTFMLEYYYKAYEPGIKEQIVEMAINSSGIRDTARILKINKNTVIRTLKKTEQHCSSEPNVSDYEHRRCFGGKTGARLRRS
jgi:transposase-like protein